MYFWQNNNFNWFDFLDGDPRSEAYALKMEWSWANDPTPSHVTNPSRLIPPPTTDSAPFSSIAPIFSPTISDLPSLHEEQPTMNPTPTLLKTYTRCPKNAHSPILEIPTSPSPFPFVETLLPTTSSLPSSSSLLLSSSNPSDSSPTLPGPPQLAPNETFRCSGRSHNPSAKLQDYVCSPIMRLLQPISFLASRFY